MKIITRGSKIGIHSIHPGKAREFWNKARSLGFSIPVIKSVDNAGMAIEVKRESPDSITITRFVNEKWDAAQDVEFWSLSKMQLAARETIQLILSKVNAEEFKAADYFEVLNEADPPTVNGYRQFAKFLIEVIKEANKFNIKLALPGLNRGTPEWSEMIAMVDTGLFQLMKDGGHILTVHEGTFDRPVGATFGDSIPGAPTLNPPGGSEQLRYRYLYSILKQRNQVVPLVISEYYPGAPITASAEEIAGRMAWYDTEIAKDYYVLGVTLFTIDPGGWVNEDYTYAFSKVVDYMNGVKNRQNALEPAVIKMVKIRDNISLNLRSGPGVSFGVLTVVVAKTIFPILEEKPGWIRVTINGWISANPVYVERL